MTRKIEIYDSTLRDGAQTGGVDFGLSDKRRVAALIDKLGVDYIEAGWPGSNPLDTAFFAEPPSLKNAELVAFAMTVKDPTTLPDSLAPLRGQKTVCVVGKSSDFQVKTALEISLSANLEVIAATIKALRTQGSIVFFDAEHFFDGYKSDRKYAMDVLRTALRVGAGRIILCDTNGGTLPHEVSDITAKVAEVIPSASLGVHFHNDTGNAVANSLAAVLVGASQVQGTFNGLGERCGNADLVSIIANLRLKMGFEVLGSKGRGIRTLTTTSHLIDELLNRQPNGAAPYVGWRAFTHKAGLHASAVAKNPNCYEHIEPQAVGNKRDILVSAQAGRSNIAGSLKLLGIETSDKRALNRLLAEVKQREFQGYAYDNAEASFEVLARRVLGKLPRYFHVDKFEALSKSGPDGEGSSARASLMVTVGDETVSREAEGNGPVNALDKALRSALSKFFPQLGDMRLKDYKVRILSPAKDTAATTRVIIGCGDDENRRWTTIGVSANVVDASLEALKDAIIWKLLKN